MTTEIEWLLLLANWLLRLPGFASNALVGPYYKYRFVTIYGLQIQEFIINNEDLCL